MRMNTNSLLLWSGVSLIDKETPLILILSGVNYSSNSKTGNMLQTYILRSDMKPTEAVKSKKDSAICGDCKFSGGNGCYVNVGNGPNKVYDSYKRGNIRKYNSTRDDGRIQGRKIRIGSYGDPSAVPNIVWHNLKRLTTGWTAYTHRWLFGDYQNTMMASTDTLEEAKLALDLGYRIFHTCADEEEMKQLPNTIWCPATPEGGMKAKCEQCGLCDGKNTKAKNVAVKLHGLTPKINKAKKVKSYGN